MLSFLFLYSASSWAQNADLRLNNRNQILIPLSGSNVQFCSDTGSNLRFQVTNDASGFANYVDLGADGLVATLTITTPGQSFSPSGTSTSHIFNVARTSNTASGTGFIGAPGFADFDWPVALEFNNTGTTTIEIEVAAVNHPYPDATANNSVTYDINILANPNVPVITTNYGNAIPVNICPGNDVQITSSSVGNEYEFFRNSISMGPRQASNVFNTTGITDGDTVNVTAYFTNGCGSTSTPLFFSVGTIPAGVLSSDASNDTACTGDYVTFTASGGGSTPWYEFLVNNTSVASSSITTYTYGPVLTDNVSITVRTYTSSVAICYDEDTINLRLNSVSGNNTLNTAIAAICAGSSPTTILSVSSFVADRQSEGATITHQWQSRINGGAFADITGATNLTYAPSILNTTTYFRRLSYSTFNGVKCTTTNASATSNIVTVTVNPNATAVLTLNAVNNTVCDGEDIIADATSSVDAQSYLFYVKRKRLWSCSKYCDQNYPCFSLF